MSAPRRQIVELAYHLARHGEDPLSPASLAVTEGRIRWYQEIGSTSCGDLLHCVAEACGYRGVALNRGDSWESEVNLSRWFVPPFAHGGTRIWRPTIDQIKPGDFLCLDYESPRAHGCVLIANNTDWITTADFGQPGGHVYADQRVYRDRKSLVFRGRRIDCAIDVDTLPWAEAAMTVFDFCAEHNVPLEPYTPLEYL